MIQRIALGADLEVLERQNSRRVVEKVEHGSVAPINIEVVRNTGQRGGRADDGLDRTTSRSSKACFIPRLSKSNFIVSHFEVQLSGGVSLAWPSKKGSHKRERLAYSTSAALSYLAL